MTKRLDLSMFGDTLLDRLHFCRLVYDLFDQILNEPNGAERLGCARPRLTTGSLRNSSRSRDTLNRAIAKGVVSISATCLFIAWSACIRMNSDRSSPPLKWTARAVAARRRRRKR